MIDASDGSVGAAVDAAANGSLADLLTTCRRFNVVRIKCGGFEVEFGPPVFLPAAGERPRDAADTETVEEAEAEEERRIRYAAGIMPRRRPIVRPPEEPEE